MAQYYHMTTKLGRRTLAQSPTRMPLLTTLPPLSTLKTPITKHIQLCIDTVGGDWSVFGGSKLVAAAIGNTYNDLKHPDRLVSSAHR